MDDERLPVAFLADSAADDDDSEAVAVQGALVADWVTRWCRRAGNPAAMLTARCVLQTSSRQ
jgi:hypothetical protein